MLCILGNSYLDIWVLLGPRCAVRCDPEGQPVSMAASGSICYVNQGNPLILMLAACE
jgi:hypothetical protein